MEFLKLTELPDFSLVKRRVESFIFNQTMVKLSLVSFENILNNLYEWLPEINDFNIRIHALNAIFEQAKRGRVSICIIDSILYAYLPKYVQPLGNILQSYWQTCPLCGFAATGFILRPRCADSKNEKIQFRHVIGLFCHDCFMIMFTQARAKYYGFKFWNEFTETDMD